MRKLTSFEQEEPAQRFSRILQGQQIDNKLLPQADGVTQDVWIDDEDRMDAAQQLLTRFRANPDQFPVATFASSPAMASVRAGKKQIVERLRGNKRRRIVVQSGNQATVSLIIFCVAVYLLIASGYGEKFLAMFYYSRYSYPLFVEIREGQLWRIITPVFLHFGILHIAFNMLWLHQLGSQVEHNQGPRFFLLLVFIVGALSNTIEYIAPPHNPFGGMSGVIYGLLGYIWAMGRYHPRSGYYMDNGSVWFMIVWLFLCMTGMFGPTANWAHLIGLVSGLGWGYLRARRAS